MKEKKRDVPGITLPGVTRTVWARRNEAGRVRYGHKGKRVIPENVVVKRAREAGYEAFRLWPSTWRFLGRLEELEEAHPEAGLEELHPRVDLGRGRKPRIDEVRLLRTSLTPRRLRALLERHSGDDSAAAGRGVPDVFVWKKRAGGRPFVRFVEVKRPGEEVARHQVEEIRFMRRLGIKAGVLTLLERRHPDRAAAARETR